MRYIYIYACALIVDIAISRARVTLLAGVILANLSIFRHKNIYKALQACVCTVFTLYCKITASVVK